MVCLYSKPAVDGLECDLEDSAVVLRINVREEVGRAVARRYGVRVTPTFIVFDRTGREAHRQSGGAPDTERLRAEMAQAGA